MHPCRSCRRDARQGRGRSASAVYSATPKFSEVVRAFRRTREKVKRKKDRVKRRVGFRGRKEGMQKGKAGAVRCTYTHASRDEEREGQNGREETKNRWEGVGPSNLHPATAPNLGRNNH